MTDSNVQRQCTGFFTPFMIGYPCYFCYFQQSPSQAFNRNEYHLYAKADNNAADTSPSNRNECEENCKKYENGYCNECNNSNGSFTIEEHTCSKVEDACTCSNNFPLHLSMGHLKTLYEGGCHTFRSHLCCNNMPSFFPSVFKCYNSVCEHHQITSSERIDKNKNKCSQDPNSNVTPKEQDKKFMPHCQHLPEYDIHYLQCSPEKCCQNRIHYIPLVPFWMSPQCPCNHNFFYSHCCMPKQQMNVQNVTSTHNAHYSEHKIENACDSEGSLTVTSLNADTDVENLSDSQNSCSPPQQKSCSLLHIAPEHEFRDCDINGNKQFKINQKYATNINNKSISKLDLNKTKQEKKYKSRIPKMIKTELTNFKKNTENSIINKTEMNNMNNLEIVNETEQYNICKEPVISSGLLTFLPEQIIHDRQYEVPVNDLNIDFGRSSENDMKVTIYQSEINKESVSLNMLNVKNKTINESEIVEKPQNMEYLKCALPKNNVTDTLYQSSEYMMKHNPTCENKLKILLNMRNDKDNITNEKELLQYDGFPSPEIDLDLMALQLIINSQTSEDETYKGIENKYDQEKEIHYKYTKNLIDIPVVNRNTELVEIKCKMPKTKSNNASKVNKAYGEKIDTKRNDSSNDLESYDPLLKNIEIKSDNLEICCTEPYKDTNIENIQECHSLISYNGISGVGINENLKQSLIPLPRSLNNLSSTNTNFIVSYLTKKHATKMESNVHYNCVNNDVTDSEVTSEFSGQEEDICNY